MNVDFRPKERRVIPNWRYYDNTLALGELDYYKDDTLSETELFPIDEYISSWLDHHSLYTAGDLISAAIANGQKNNPHVVEAAKSVLSIQNDASFALKNAASFILSNHNEYKTEIAKLENDALLKLENSQNVRDKIHSIRLQMYAYPFNPFLYVDMARAYISIGQRYKAENMIKVALYLAPDNRFVARAACRLYIHLQDFDKAYFVIKHNSAFKHDPWMMASELTVKMLMGRYSGNIKEASRIVESRSYTPHSITELASSLGTIEMYCGTRKKSRDFFNISLFSPNDNTLAQAQYAANNSIPVIIENNKYSLQNDYEAKTISKLIEGDYKSAMSHIIDWVCDMPFSHKPVMIGANIAMNYLRDFNLSAKILEVGRKADGQDLVILNDLAYSYARDNKVNKARETMDHLLKFAQNETMTDSLRTCIRATQGLIAFRNSDSTSGRTLYEEAIKMAESNKEKDPTTYAKALLNYKREELLATANNRGTILADINNIPQKQQEELSFLIKEIIDIVESKNEN